MKEKDIYSELSSIRDLMERSTKFISLSGMSGVMAGIYALAGAFTGYRLLYYENGWVKDSSIFSGPLLWWPLYLVALIVLLLSVSTGIWFTLRKARKTNQHFWNPGSKQLFRAMALPLLAGGAFMIMMVCREYYTLLVPASLIFYGLSLFAGSNYTFSDVKWLGYCEIILGLAALIFPLYNFGFWVTGFGVLHIVYGTRMHLKYDR